VNHDPDAASSPTGDVFEDEFNCAVDRIVAWRLRDPDLQADAAAGRLVLNKVNVAKEAGRSRTKLYECGSVIARIDTLCAGPRETAHDTIANLRSQNENLRAERQQSLNAAAAMLLRMRDLERRSDQAVRRAQRQAARPDPNKVVGTVIKFPGGADDT